MIYNLLSTFKYTTSLETDNILGKKEGSYFYSCFTAYKVEAQGHYSPNEPDASCDIPSHGDSGLGYMTSFGQWDISKLSDTSRLALAHWVLSSGHHPERREDPREMR